MSADQTRFEAAMPSTHTTWDPLLKSISAHQKSFLSLLVQDMVFHLVAPSVLDISTDTYREAMVIWLEYLLLDKDWAATRRRSGVDGSHVISTCFQCPNIWTAKLSKLLISNTSFQKIKSVYGKEVAALDAPGSNVSTSPDEERMAPREPGRWQTVKGTWTPKPIGLI